MDVVCDDVHIRGTPRSVIRNWTGWILALLYRSVPGDMFAMQAIERAVSPARSRRFQRQELGCYRRRCTSFANQVSWYPAKANMRRQDLDQLEGHIIGSTGIGQKCKYNGVASQHRVVKPLLGKHCLLYTSPSPRDLSTSRMPSSA